MSGMEPYVIGAIIAGAAGVDIYEQEQAMESQEKALELKRKQSEAQAAQQQIQRDDALMRVQGQQMAQATAQGMSLSSGTFGAMELGSQQKFAKSSEIGAYNLQMQELSIDQQRSALEDQFWSSVFGTVANTAMQLYSVSEGTTGGSLPAPKPTPKAGAPGDFWAKQQQLMQDNSRPNLVQSYDQPSKYAQWLYENGE